MGGEGSATVGLSASANGHGPMRRPAPALVSVVVPVRNGERHIGEQLEALSRQTYRGGWELVVVDNGCEDSTLEIVERWRPRLPAVRVVDASDRRGLNYARNRGAQAAAGDLLAFCDADDVVVERWLEALAEAARDADLVGGSLDMDALNDALVQVWRSDRSVVGLHLRDGFLPVAPGGNSAVWRDVALAVGWDESFRFGSSDVEFSWRLQLAGYRIAAADDAVVYLRFRRTLVATTRQAFLYGQSDAQLFRRFRALGVQGTDPRETLRIWRRQLATVGDLRSEPSRGRWLRTSVRCVGRAVGSVRWRVLYL
jgi:glycosyltransferase involved in cell wall biosynthesis